MDYVEFVSIHGFYISSYIAHITNYSSGVGWGVGMSAWKTEIN